MEYLRYFTVGVIGIVLVTCAVSEFVRWWMSEDKEDELELP